LQKTLTYYHRMLGGNLICGATRANERPLSGVKRTWPTAVQMSANDPKRTFVLHCRMSVFGDKAYIKMGNTGE
jgi:hypothetical protein